MEKPLQLLLLTGLCCLGASAFSQNKNVTFVYTVENPAAIEIGLNFLKSNDCVGGPGVIDIEPTGGVASLTFSWTGPGAFTSTDEDLFNLGAGDYTVTADDGNGCPVSRTFSVTNTCPYTCMGFSVDVVDLSDPSNCNAADGSLEFAINGGAGPFTWSLYRITDSYTMVSSGSTAGTTLNFNGLTQANYELSVTDQNACTAYTSHHLSSSFYLYEEYVYGTNTSCTAPNGAMNLTVVGAQLPEDLTIDWFNTETLELVTTNVPQYDEAPAGYYNITVTDNRSGCKIYGFGYVTNYMIHLDESHTITPVTQCTSPDGAINLTVTSGTGDYSYIWNKVDDGTFGETTQDLSNVTAGSYEVYAYDNISRCYIASTIDVPDNIVRPTITTGAPVANSACSFPYNGALSVSASGTAGPYTYGWFATDVNPFTTEANPTDIRPGRYGYLVTDASTGCTTVVSVLSPDAKVVEDTSFPVTVSENIIGNTSCNVPYNGAIDVTIDASGRAYTVEWWSEDDPYDPISTDEDLTDLEPGVYELRLSVACGNNSPPVITSPNLNATSGVTSIDLDLLTIISDPDDNLDITSIEVASPPLSGADAIITNNGTTVILNLDYTGITFNGTDQLRIRACDDLAVCTERDLLVNVNVTADSDIFVFNALSLNGDPLNNHFHIQNIEQYDNHVTIYNRWGDAIYEANDYNNTDISFAGESDSGKEVPSGTYFYKIEIEGNKTLTGYLSLKR